MVWTKWDITINGGDLDDFEDAWAMLEDEQPAFRRAVEGATAMLGKMIQMPAKTWLNYIIWYGDREKMNTVVKDGKFPAYDIVVKLSHTPRAQPTQKQWLAITNVFMWTKYGVKFSREDVQEVRHERD
jgi:hypothetical protein